MENIKTHIHDDRHDPSTGPRWGLVGFILIIGSGHEISSSQGWIAFHLISPFLLQDQAVLHLTHTSKDKVSFPKKRKDDFMADAGRRAGDEDRDWVFFATGNVLRESTRSACIQMMVIAGFNVGCARDNARDREGY